MTATSLIFGYTVFGLWLKIKKGTSHFSDFLSLCSILYFIKALNLLGASKPFLLCRPYDPVVTTQLCRYRMNAEAVNTSQMEACDCALFLTEQAVGWL